MITIIAGTRKILDYDVVAEGVEASGWTSLITRVVSGEAIGVDQLGRQWATRRGIPVDPFPVTNEDYAKHGRYKAPKVRNERMACYGECLILVWDGVSGGSKDMLERAVAHGLPVYQHKVRL